LPALLSISTASILSTPPNTFIFAHVSIWLILYSLARLGASHRGSTILQTGLFFIVIDSASLAMWFAPPSALRTSIICLPALSRLLVLYLAPFSRSFVVNSPRHVLLLWLATQIPIGVNMLLQFSVPTWVKSPTSILLSILIAIIWILHDRNRNTIAVASLAIFNILMLAQL